MSAGPAETLVVDASVATKWHLTGEEDTATARLILQRYAQGEIQLLAPSHICYEVPSAITAATLGRSARLSPEEGREAIAEFLSLNLPTVETSALVLSSYSLVQEHHIAFYDGLYLALSQALELPLVTADRRFYERIRQLPNIVWISDYQGD
ncbi:MAG: type II toxin-antitoxin system VapC family toxin [Chloroflexi bacterium]|nr:type II toxin-antitoxin system VapC family toxin [Chloroflexota bacterium]